MPGEHVQKMSCVAVLVLYVPCSQSIDHSNRPSSRQKVTDMYREVAPLSHCRTLLKQSDNPLLGTHFPHGSLACLVMAGFVVWLALIHIQYV